MDGIELTGLVASLLTTSAYLPQVLKTWRTRSADDFSLRTLIMLIVGIGLWTIYGMMQALPAVWIGNGVTLVMAASILSVKLRHVPLGSGGGIRLAAQACGRRG